MFKKLACALALFALAAEARRSRSSSGPRSRPSSSSTSSGTFGRSRPSGSSTSSDTFGRKKPKRPSGGRGRDVDGNGSIDRTAKWGTTTLAGGETIFVGILDTEGIDQPDIIAWGCGLTADTTYSIELGAAETSTSSIDLSLLAWNDDDPGCDWLSPGSKLTGSTDVTATEWAKVTKPLVTDAAFQLTEITPSTVADCKKTVGSDLKHYAKCKKEDFTAACDDTPSSSCA